MDKPEKLAPYGTQDVEKQNKNTTQYLLNITKRKQTQPRHEPSHKQLEAKTNRTSPQSYSIDVIYY